MQLDLKDIMRRYVPERLKVEIRRMRFDVRKLGFTPYIKNKTIGEHSFDFLVSDPVSREWYDRSDAGKLDGEMAFIHDRLVSPGARVIECGANYGFTTILLGKWVGNDGAVLAFEPVPRNCEILRRNLDMNQMANVSMEAKAVGESAGVVNMSGEPNSRVTDSGAGAQVPVVRLDDYLDFAADVLKIDVEGFEMAVLKGASETLKTRPHLALEIHTESLKNFGATFDDLYDLVDFDGYECWILWNEQGTPEPFIPRAVEVTTRVHIFAINPDRVRSYAEIMQTH